MLLHETWDAGLLTVFLASPAELWIYERLLNFLLWLSLLLCLPQGMVEVGPCGSFLPRPLVVSCQEKWPPAELTEKLLCLGNESW